MKYKYFLISIAIIILIVLMLFLFNSQYSLEQNILKSKVNFDDILHIEKIDNNIIVFHKHLIKDDYGLGMFILEKQNRKWYTKLDSASSINTNISLDFINLSNENKLLYGYMNDLTIKSIKIAYKDHSQEVNLIQTEWKPIWYTIVEDKEFNIQLYDSSKNLIQTIPVGVNK